MVNVNVVRASLFLLLFSTNLVGCAAQMEEGDEGAGARGETLGSALSGGDDGDVDPRLAATTSAEKDNTLLGCWPRIEASNWYCCGRFRECKAVYICEYCTNSKSCYQQGSLHERSSPGCY